MIVWLLDLQLPMQLVPITTNVVSLNPALDFWLKKFFLCDLFTLLNFLYFRYYSLFVKEGKYYL
jgi:hypothetical protein